MAAIRLLLCGVVALSINGCWSQMEFKKCCGLYEMFDTSGVQCIPSPWPRHPNLNKDYQALLLWITKWLPPGLLHHAVTSKNISISLNNHGFQNGSAYLDIVKRVDSSVMWNEKDVNRSNSNVLILANDLILRPSPGGGFRLARYCAEAAPPPLGPFVVRFRTLRWNLRPLDAVHKCCPRATLLVRRPAQCAPGAFWCDGERLVCVKDPAARWSPSNSSALSGVDPEVPYQDSRAASQGKVLLVDASSQDGDFWASFARTWKAETLFSTWIDGCFDFFRDPNGLLREVVAVHDYPRPTRGAYWLARHLSVGAILLLAAALAAVAGNKRTRTTAHGWALASHAVCLLLFNVTQVAFTWSISDTINAVAGVPEHLEGVCLAFGFTAYFLQTAAGCWLTAICVNMARGFRISPVMPGGGSSKRRFAWLAGAAWGATVVLTTACAVAVAVSPMHPVEGGGPANLSWYQPSLMETRTCYLDFNAKVVVKDRTVSAKGSVSVKWGTLLYFYAPMFALVGANVVSLVITARRIHYLRRGSAFLRADHERDARRSSVDAQSLMVYLKLLLSAGGVEIVMEAVPWLLLDNRVGNYLRLLDHGGLFAYQFDDHTYAYRTAGYCADFLRALIVLWLCAPERGTLRAAWRRLREGSTH